MKVIKYFKKYMRISKKEKVTRSYGFLELFLARQRARIANGLIPDEHRSGKIFDIGCGSYPIFLLTTKFVEKFGMDKVHYSNSIGVKRFTLVNHDIEKGGDFPFAGNSMDVVTMLAVIEHIEGTNLTRAVSEMYRVLKPDGVCIFTTPSPWAEIILRIMSKVKLVSRIEAKDHKTSLNNREIIDIFRRANFSSVKFGYFELFMNRWFLCKK